MEEKVREEGEVEEERDEVTKVIEPDQVGIERGKQVTRWKIH